MNDDAQSVLHEANALLQRMGGQEPASDLNEALARIVSSGPALIQGGAEMVRRLIDAGADVNTVDHHDRTPLHNAVRLHDLPTVRILLLNGADVHARDLWGMTPLRAAVFQVHWSAVDVEIIRVLIASGSDVNAACTRGDSPLNVAIRQQKTDVVRMLVDAGADVAAVNQNAGGPLHLLVKVAGRSSAPAEIIRVLVKAGSDVNCADGDGNTPLHLARERGHRQCISALLGSGAREDIKNLLGRTPMDLQKKSRGKNRRKNASVRNSDT